MNHHLSPFISPCHSPAIREFRKNASPSMINLKSPSSSSRCREGHDNILLYFCVHSYISFVIFRYVYFITEIRFSFFTGCSNKQGRLMIFSRRWGEKLREICYLGKQIQIKNLSARRCLFSILLRP